MLRSALKFLILFPLIISGCSSDIAIIDKKETRVVVDSFIQPDPIEKLDILVALDTSGSMNDNYEDVGNGMDLLRSDIESLTLDYRFGFITADSTYYNYLGPYDSGSSSIDLLLAPTLLGAQQGEEPFASTYSFFNSEDIIFFRRSDADFLLFLISDEDEQSGIPPALFKEWMDEEFKEVSHDVVAIAQPENGSCGTIVDVGRRYIELSALYEKDVIDICSEDWSIWLSESSFLTRLLDSIELSEVPVSGSIVVYLNNQITYEWSYSNFENIVHLDFTLDYGDLIEVGYEVEI